MANSNATQTGLCTAEGLVVYDLAPQAAELWAVAGPDGFAGEIDPDNLPEGFRWVDGWEWETLHEADYSEVCIDCGSEHIEEGTCVDCQTKDFAGVHEEIHEESRRFAFATDSESGFIDAATFDAACEVLKGSLPDDAVDNGGWGWVRNEDGRLFEINC